MTVIWGVEDRTPGQDARDPDTHEHIPDTHEYIHPVVFYAQQEQKYSSGALEGFKRVPIENENPHGQGHSWIDRYIEREAKSWKNRSWTQ